MLLRKEVCLYELIDSWERFNETSLPDEEAISSNLNIKGITDVDNKQVNRVFKHFDNKNIGDYHDLYFQSDAFLLAGVYENFRNECI